MPEYGCSLFCWLVSLVLFCFNSTWCSLSFLDLWFLSVINYEKFLAIIISDISSVLFFLASSIPNTCLEIISQFLDILLFFSFFFLFIFKINNNNRINFEKYLQNSKLAELIQCAIKKI